LKLFCRHPSLRFSLQVLVLAWLARQAGWEPGSTGWRWTVQVEVEVDGLRPFIRVSVIGFA
jgi:hypothetical protein